MNCICPYIGNNNPIWLICFTGVETTNQFSNEHEYAHCQLIVKKTLEKPMTMFSKELEQHLEKMLATYLLNKDCCESCPQFEAMEAMDDFNVRCPYSSLQTVQLPDVIVFSHVFTTSVMWIQYISGESGKKKQQLPIYIYIRWIQYISNLYQLHFFRRRS